MDMDPNDRWEARKNVTFPFLFCLFVTGVSLLFVYLGYGHR